MHDGKQCTHEMREKASGCQMHDGKQCTPGMREKAMKCEKGMKHEKAMRHDATMKKTHAVKKEANKPEEFKGAASEREGADTPTAKPVKPAPPKQPQESMLYDNTQTVNDGFSP
jgi:hypothetical protein